MNNRNTIGGVVCLLLTASVCFIAATPVPTFDLYKLVGDADVIAMGTIEEVLPAGAVLVATPNGTINARLMLGNIAVDQVLKGAWSGTSLRVQFLEPEMPNGYHGVARNTYRIVFLKQTSDGYAFVSPYSPSVIAAPGPPIQAASPADRVIAGVARVLQSGTSAPSAKTEAIHVLRGINNAAALVALRLGLEAPDPTVRLTAAAALAATNDLAGFAVAEGVLLQPAPDISPDLLANLKAGIAQGVRHQEAVPGLTRLLGLDDAETRRAACKALAQIASTEAIHALVVALDDQDFEVRLNAVYGIARRSGQPQLVPSWQAFRADESRFIRPLRAWIASNAGTQ